MGKTTGWDLSAIIVNGMSTLGSSGFNSDTENQNPILSTEKTDKPQNITSPLVVSPVVVTPNNNSIPSTIVGGLHKSARYHFPMLGQPLAPSPSLPPEPGVSHSAKMKKLGEEREWTSATMTTKELLSIDKWGWRKYGQKVITFDGKRFNRNYYKCSSKNCKVKRHVDVLRPHNFRISYHGIHFHQPPTRLNVLAGLTRGTTLSILNPPGARRHPAAYQPSKSTHEENIETAFVASQKGLSKKSEGFTVVADGFNNLGGFKGPAERPPPVVLSSLPVASNDLFPVTPLVAPALSDWLVDEVSIQSAPNDCQRGSPMGNQFEGGKVDDEESEEITLIPNPIAMVSEEMVFGGISPFHVVGEGYTGAWAWE